MVRLKKTTADIMWSRYLIKSKHVVAEFEKDNKKLYESAWKSQFFSGMMMPIMQFVGNLGICNGGSSWVDGLPLKDASKWVISSPFSSISVTLPSQSSRSHR